MMMVNVMARSAGRRVGNKLVGIHDGAKFNIVLAISKKDLCRLPFKRVYNKGRV